MTTMNTEAQRNFNRIATAIGYIRDNATLQPSLEEIAAHVQLSPSHFQRVFTEWAGTSPKKFLQFLTIEYAKKLLTQNRMSTVSASLKTGLSGTGRLHDLFITIEGMTPGEYKNGGQNLLINYSFSSSPFGNILIASTTKGVCYLGFIENEHTAFELLRARFPNAQFKKQFDRLQQNALRIFTQSRGKLSNIRLHLKGTDFQLKVWEALLTIPTGRLSTYGGVAQRIHQSTACRAVGTAVGQNPVAFLIPCHRVIQSSGILGNYHWGSTRKTAMIGWEAAQIGSE